MDKQHVFIIGSKGIPANYGGFETFVDKLTEYQRSEHVCYHVAAMGKEFRRYEHNGARCFVVKVPEIGPAKAVYYDLAALRYCLRYCKRHPEIKHPIIYILACRIGPFLGHFKKQIKAVGGSLYINPDGHEWLRAKWSYPIRRYWKFSEKLMVKHADLSVCDSKNMQSYIEKEYGAYQPKTTFIAYGADTTASALADHDTAFMNWLREKELAAKEYYLIVGRFVPENNYETMIREFLLSGSKRSLALITNAEDKFLEQLGKATGFDKDARVKFVGTVYDQELLKKIREQAYGYLHGHEVGGTNPSLLEALGSTDLNLLLDVGFNREVGEDGALYWSKRQGDLARLLEQADALRGEQIAELAAKAKARIKDHYSWSYITEEYEKLWERAND